MAFSRVSEVKPGDPITLRVAELRVSAGTLARTKLTCRPGERLLHSSQSVGLYTGAVPTVRERAAVRVVHVRRGGAILVSATRHGLDPEVVAVVQVQAECAR
jgi:hypothetical protein